MISVSHYKNNSILKLVVDLSFEILSIFDRSIYLTLGTNRVPGLRVCQLPVLSIEISSALDVLIHLSARFPSDLLPLGAS